jgi:hypothetical protein
MRGRKVILNAFYDACVSPLDYPKNSNQIGPGALSFVHLFAVKRSPVIRDSVPARWQSASHE